MHTADFVCETDSDQDYWLVILTHTPALFLVDGEMKEYPANCAALYPPYCKTLYRACADTYSDDWMRFQSTEPFITEPNLLPLGTPFLIPDPEYIHRIFQLLAPENFFNYDYKAFTIDYLLRVLLNKLLEASHHTDYPLYYQALLNLRKEIYNNPNRNWTISAMADYLNVSVNYVQRLYKDTFGIPCMKDVIQSRIKLAKEHLSRSSYSISEIANICGYNNLEHFFRQFRKTTGITPYAFRNLNRR